MKTVTRTLAILAFTASSTFALAQEDTCFPACTAAEPPAVAPTPACSSGGAEIMRSAEQLQDRIRPARELLSIVRSPQGFVIQQISERVVHIPAWVGYAMDPLGSLKGKLIDKARTETKRAIGLDRSACTPESPEPEHEPDSGTWMEFPSDQTGAV